ncbi:MAG: glutamine--tRNA ligase/YqeY domain fusion protein [Planctomycetes bacterium]|nr:glutamine--tRNA ligase/YqeY domain fusion protein [Planctomycetota bacterium]MCB9917982.1 glutamine--tRNA ligase/YqeY domain fusion protein [Planctomycetota bacterium]
MSTGKPTNGNTTEPSPGEPLDFVRSIVRDDIRSGKHGGRVHTRFPPAPTGFLHLGHAKAICVDFGIAEEFGGKCNLRLDDTDPGNEKQEYVDAIQEDIHWLGYDWDDRLFYASDYFDQLYEWAKLLIQKGAAYVDEQDVATMRAQRGTVLEAGTASPFRDRPVEESLAQLERMKNGEFEEGGAVLRAKIDMASPNMHMRDPVMYRIKKITHNRTGDRWCIYPTYDWAHGQSDAIEGITHSLCSLEFEIHRPLYDWFLEQIGDIHRPRQIEFARLNVTHTVTQKRKLRALVERGHVDGWDDPRMPTLRGMRRRGYTPASIRNFCTRVGLAKFNSLHEIGLLEFSLREDLNVVAERRMAVLDPIRLVIENWPDGTTDTLEAINNPEDESAGSREVPFGREIYIEREDFLVDAPKKFFRLAPGREVRLRYAYLVTCTGFETDSDGNVTLVRATYDPDSRGGNAPDGRKVKGTIHWVSAEHAVDATVRLYDHLYAVEDPSELESDDGQDGTAWERGLNKESLQVVTGCKLEPALALAQPEEALQFERKGYFVLDSKDSKPDALVFNRSVALRDSWAKEAAKLGAPS